MTCSIGDDNIKTMLAKYIFVYKVSILFML